MYCDDERSNLVESAQQQQQAGVSGAGFVLGDSSSVSSASASVDTATMGAGARGEAANGPVASADGRKAMEETRRTFSPPDGGARVSG